MKKITLIQAQLLALCSAGPDSTVGRLRALSGPMQQSFERRQCDQCGNDILNYHTEASEMKRMAPRPCRQQSHLHSAAPRNVAPARSAETQTGAYVRDESLSVCMRVSDGARKIDRHGGAIHIHFDSVLAAARPDLDEKMSIPPKCVSMKMEL